MFRLRSRSTDLDRFMAETARRMRETDRRMAETDRRMAETDVQLKKLGVYLDRLSQKLEGLGDKLGYFTEGMALPSMESILQQQFGMETVAPRCRVRREGMEQEYDVLAWADGEVNAIIVVEIKSRVRREAIGQLARQLETLFEMCPMHEGKRRLGILVGVDWDPDVEQAAWRQGFYTARIHDEIFELTVPDGFVSPGLAPLPLLPHN